MRKPYLPLAAVSLDPDLIRYNRSSKKWKTISRQPETYTAFNVQSIIPTQTDVWFVGQSGGGVSRWDKQRASWENYHQGDVIREIALDGDYVWFRGAVSVDRLNLKDGSWRYFKEADGVGPHFTTAMAVKDGEAWLGTTYRVCGGEKIGLLMFYSLVE